MSNINATVNSILNSQAKPYLGQMKDTNRLYGKEQAAAKEVGRVVQHQLAKAGTAAQAQSGDLLNLAASRATGGEDRMARNMQFLQGALGGYMGSYGQGQLQQGAQLGRTQEQVENTGMAALAGLNQQAIARDNQMLKGSSSMANQEWRRASADRRAAQLRALKNEISRIRGQRGQLHRQLFTEDREYGLKSDYLGLQKQQHAESVRQFNESQREQQRQFNQTLQHQQSQAAADAAEKAAEGKEKGKSHLSAYGHGIHKDVEPRVDAALTALAEWRGKGKRRPQDILRKGMSLLRTQPGINANQAAWVVLNHGLGRSQVKAMHPVDTHRYLKKMGVVGSVRKKLIKHFYGKHGWLLVSQGQAPGKPPKGNQRPTNTITNGDTVTTVPVV